MVPPESCVSTAAISWLRASRPRFLGGGVDRVGGLPAFGVTELAVDVELIVGHGCLLPRRGGARHGGRGSRLLGASPSGGQRDPAPEKDGGRRRRRPPRSKRAKRARLLAAVRVADPRAAVEVRRAGGVGRTAAIAGRAG